MSNTGPDEYIADISRFEQWVLNLVLGKVEGSTSPATTDASLANCY